MNSEIKETLRSANSIHLVTNDLTVPWDIIHDGQEFFQMKYSFGISPMIKRQELQKEPKRNSKLKVLFIVDTKNNLPQTREETKKILSLMEKDIKHNKIEYMFLQGDEATRSHISDLLQKQYFDIIHFATHSDFNPTNPKETGVVLSDGILQTRDVYKVIKDDPPWLVFMNACESARTRDLSYFEKYDELSGLGIAFVKAGAPSYIGTKSIVNDYSASEIATTFYRNLLQGLTVGESLKKAKKKFFDGNPQDLSWSAFILYGDPNLQKELGEENIICARCSSTNLPASKYCNNCGLRLNNNDQINTTYVMQGAPISSSEIIEDDFLSCELPSYGVKISYPSNWRKLEKWQGQGNVVVGFVSPQKNGITQRGYCGIGLIKIQPKMTLEQYVQLNIGDLKNKHRDFLLIESTHITLAGRPAHRLVYSEGGRINMHNITLNQNTAYEITYLSNPSMYSIYLPIVQKMLDSFEISHINTTSNRITSSPKLKHIPSNASDFTNYNDRVLKVLFVNVYKSRIGNWIMTGQIQNMGNETLNFIKPHAQLVDANGTVVGLINGYTHNNHLPPGESSEIGGVALQESIMDIPVSFKLGFEWNAIKPRYRHKE